jgi:hypothetical protein
MYGGKNLKELTYQQLVHLISIRNTRFFRSGGKTNEPYIFS